MPPRYIAQVRWGFDGAPQLVGRLPACRDRQDAVAQRSRTRGSQVLPKATGSFAATRLT